MVTSSGKLNVTEFAPFVTVISSDVPVIVAAAGPSAPPIINCPFVVSATEPIASVPLSCDINTALSVIDVAPIPPCATGSAVSNVSVDSSACEPLTITFFQLAILFLL